MFKTQGFDNFYCFAEVFQSNHLFSRWRCSFL